MESRRRSIGHPCSLWHPGLTRTESSRRCNGSVNCINSFLVARHVVHEVTWSFPPSTWVKFNIDGVSKGNLSNAWQRFTSHWLLFGICSWTLGYLYIGLNLAYQWWYRHVMVESGSQSIITTLNRSNIQEGCYQLVRKVMSLALRQWDIIHFEGRW